jgi:hypothetical protein
MDRLSVTEDTCVAAKGDLVIAELADEAVLLDGERSCYYGLNQVGFHVLELSKEPRTVREIIERMLDEYEVDRDKLKADILSFLSEMEDLDLIEVKNGRESHGE